jgi:AcrR family transcriptional regulator
MNERSSEKKQQIIDKAIEYFSRNGIADTKIEDITKDIGIGKGTLYLYFSGKKDLLLHCIDRLTTFVIPNDVWLDIREETNYKLRFQKRLIAFLKTYPTFCGILNLVSQSLESNDTDLSKKAGEAYRLLAGPLIKDLRWAVSHGWVREVDQDVIAFIMLAAGEGLGNMLKIDPRYTIEKVAEITWDFMIGGIGLAAAGKPEEAGSLYWDIDDSDNNKINLHDLCCDNKSYFSGEFGKGALQVPLHRIASVKFAKSKSPLSAIVELKSGKTTTLIVDQNMKLTGETEFGGYEVPVSQVSRFRAVMSEPEGERGEDV